MGYIAIRHFDCTDNFRFNIDDVYIGNPWIYAENLENTNYTIEGLAPETTYDLQVQAFNDDSESDWVDAVFTTLPEPVIPDVYILGGNVDAWAPNQGVMMNYDEETGKYTYNITFDGRFDGFNYFGFTTAIAENNDQGGWDYIEPYRFGAIANEGTDYEYTGEEDYISLTWDDYHAIKIPAGEYNMTLDLPNMRLVIEKVVAPGMKGDVNGDGVVNITDVTTLISASMSDNFDNIIFNNADMNEDGVISITDVTMLINYVMSLR